MSAYNKEPAGGDPHFHISPTVGTAAYLRFRLHTHALYVNEAISLAESLEARVATLTAERDALRVIFDLAPIKGRLVRVGTMQVSGEELTGYFVEAPRDSIEALKRLPLYEPVAIVQLAPTAQPTTPATP